MSAGFVIHKDEAYYTAGDSKDFKSACYSVAAGLRELRSTSTDIDERYDLLKTSFLLENVADSGVTTAIELFIKPHFTVKVFS